MKLNEHFSGEVLNFGLVFKLLVPAFELPSVEQFVDEDFNLVINDDMKIFGVLNKVSTNRIKDVVTKEYEIYKNLEIAVERINYLKDFDSNIRLLSLPDKKDSMEDDIVFEYGQKPNEDNENSDNFDF